MALKIVPARYRPIARVLLQTLPKTKSPIKLAKAVWADPKARAAVSHAITKIRNLFIVKVIKKNPCNFECQCKHEFFPIVNPKYTTKAVCLNGFDSFGKSTADPSFNSKNYPAPKGTPGFKLSRTNLKIIQAQKKRQAIIMH